MKILHTYLLFFLFLMCGTGIKLYAQKNEVHKQIIQHTPENKKIADSLLSIGEKHQNAGKFLDAMTFFEKSLKIYQKLGDQKGIGDSFNKIATTYYYQ